MKNLHDRLVLSTRTGEGQVGGTIIAAGPLNKQPATMAYRIVLVETAKQFVVWRESFASMPLVGMTFTDEQTNFSDGDYFGKDQLVKAVKCFGDRISNTAEFLQSLYREEPAAT